MIEMQGIQDIQAGPALHGSAGHRFHPPEQLQGQR